MNYNYQQQQGQPQPPIPPKRLVEIEKPLELMPVNYQTNLLPYFRLQNEGYDSISDIRWLLTQTNKYIYTSNWDSTIRMHELMEKHSVTHFALENDCPVTKITETLDPGFVFFGDTYGQVYAYNANKSLEKIKVCEHKGVITGLQYNPQHKLLISSGTDGYIKLFDFNQMKLVFSINEQCKITCLSMCGNMFCVGLQNGFVDIFDLSKIQTVTNQCVGDYARLPAIPISCTMFKNGAGCCFGSIDGTVTNYFFNQPATNYSFKAAISKDQTQRSHFFQVNCLDFRFDGTLMSAGSNGAVQFWDIFQRKRLYSMPSVFQGVPVTAMSYSPDGKFIACGLGYDWSRGVYGSHTVTESGLFVKMVDDVLCRK